MRKFKKILILICLLSLIAVTEYCFARAGGGGGSSGGGSGGGGFGGGILSLLLTVVIAPFLLVYSIIVSVKLERKRNKVKSLTDKLNKLDKHWNYREMMTSVEQIFFKVQEAWMERNQDLAKDYMSERIYQKHKLQTDEMLANGTKNILKKINLKEAMIIGLKDYDVNSEDCFSVYIKGSMIDYTINDKTEKFLSGNDYEPEDFKEIWTFIRHKDRWVLDEIDQNVTLGDISSAKAFTEAKLS